MVLPEQAALLVIELDSRGGAAGYQNDASQQRLHLVFSFFGGGGQLSPRTSTPVCRSTRH